MHHRPLITRKTVNVAAWSLLASMALALTLIACGPGPTTGPTPTGDVTITVTVVGDGRATFDAADFTCSSGTCTLMVDEGTDVSLAAVPNAGRVLVAWDGPCSPFADTCAWEANEDVGVTVTFAPHALRFDLQGDGEGRFEIDVAGDVTECRDACGVALQLPLQVGITHYSEGSTHTNLGPWTGPCFEGNVSDRFCRVDVEGATTIGKTWRLWPLLTLEKEGVGLVSSDPPGIDCGVTCTSDSAYFDFDTSVTLTAAAAPGTTFGGWSGDACDGSPQDTCVVVMDARTTITASFATGTYTLTVGTSGDGTVTSDPEGINTNVGIDEFDFEHGERIVLTADPANTFTRWTGDQCADLTTPTCTFTITEDTTVTAEFVPNYTLIVNRAGDGAGTVTSLPPGINLDDGDTTATATFPQGQIQLIAVADEDTTTIQWSNVTCTEGNDTETCTFTITEDTTVTAEFVPNYTLIVNRAGDGAGTVTSLPPGINLDDGDTTATATFPQGQIQLIAVADEDTTTIQWSNVTCTEGNDTETCTFTITRDTDITATFTPITPPIDTDTLTVTTSGDGTGNVTSRPPGIDLYARASTATFTHGTEIRLTAHPDSDSDLDEWSGVICDEGDDEDTCTFILIQNTTVDAEFDD